MLKLYHFVRPWQGALCYRGGMADFKKFLKFFGKP
jgi:hypothetical protein